MYQNLSTQFYDLSNPIPDSAELDFYLSYAKKGSKILEPMCGSGRLLISLFDAGYDIEGFDASQYMLDSLHKKNSSANVWQEYLENLDIKNHYDLVLIPFGSLNLIIDTKKSTQGLKNIHDALKNNGVFIFELITHNLANKSAFNQRRKAMKITSDGKRITEDTLILPVKDDIGTSICQYQLSDSDKVLLEEVETYQIRFYDLNKLDSLLTDIGFKSIKHVKAYDPDSTPGEKDEVIIYECRKL